MSEEDLLVYQREIRRRIEEAEDANWHLLLERCVSAGKHGCGDARHGRLQERLRDAERGCASAKGAAEAFRVQLEEREKILVSVGCRIAEDTERSQTVSSTHAAELSAARGTAADATAAAALLERKLATEQARTAALHTDHASLQKRHAHLTSAQEVATRAKEALSSRTAALAAEVERLQEENRRLAVSLAASPPRAVPQEVATPVEEEVVHHSELPPPPVPEDYRGYDVAAALETQRMLTNEAQDEVSILHEEITAMRKRVDAANMERECWREQAKDAEQSAEHMRSELADAIIEAEKAVADAEAASQAAKRAEQNAQQLDIQIAQMEGIMQGVEEAFVSTIETASAKDVVINYLAETLDEKDADRTTQLAKYKRILESMTAQLERNDRQLEEASRDKAHLETMLATAQTGYPTHTQMQMQTQTQAQLQTQAQTQAYNDEMGGDVEVSVRKPSTSLPASVDQDMELVLVASKEAIESLQQENKDLRSTLNDMSPSWDTETEKVMIASRETIESLQAANEELSQRLTHTSGNGSTKAAADAIATLQADKKQLERDLAVSESTLHALQENLHSQEDLMHASKDTIESLQADVLRLQCEGSADMKKLLHERMLEEQVMYESKQAIEGLQREVTRLREGGRQSDAYLVERMGQENVQLREELESCMIYERRCNDLEGELLAAKQRTQELSATVKEISDTADVSTIRNLETVLEENTVLVRKNAKLEQEVLNGERAQADLMTQLEECRSEVLSISATQTNEWHIQEDRYQHEVSRASQAQQRCSALELEANDLREENKHSAYCQAKLQSRETDLSNKLRQEAQRCEALETTCQKLDVEKNALVAKLAEVTRDLGAMHTLDQSRSDEFTDTCRMEAHRTETLERKCSELQHALRVTEDEVRGLKTELMLTNRESSQNAERKAAALERDVHDLTDALRSSHRQLDDFQQSCAMKDKKIANLEQNVHNLAQSLSDTKEEQYITQANLRKSQKYSHTEDNQSKLWEAKCMRLERELRELKTSTHPDPPSLELTRMRRMNENLQDDLNALREQHSQVKFEKADVVRELQLSVQRAEGRHVSHHMGAGMKLRPTPAPSSYDHLTSPALPHP